MMLKNITTIFSLFLQNFRCFQSAQFCFQKAVVIISGKNGSGKTSILEALHYLATLSTIRSGTMLDLIYDQTDTFYLKGEFYDDNSRETVEVGYKNRSRHIKIGGLLAKSSTDYFKRIFKAIFFMEDDVLLLQGLPSRRRDFLSEALVQKDDLFRINFRQSRKTLQQRNAVLNQLKITGRGPTLDLKIWTQRWFDAAQEESKALKDYLEALSNEINIIVKMFNIEEFVPEITLHYDMHEGLIEEYENNFDQLWENKKDFWQKEIYANRTLFGPHLDDFSVVFEQKNMRTRTSRGQQKLVVFLLKIAQYRLLNQTQLQLKTLFLLDDFFADFDEVRLNITLTILKAMPVQLIFTSPQTNNILTPYFPEDDIEMIRL